MLIGFVSCPEPRSNTDTVNGSDVTNKFHASLKPANVDTFDFSSGPVTFDYIVHQKHIVYSL